MRGLAAILAAILAAMTVVLLLPPTRLGGSGVPAGVLRRTSPALAVGVVAAAAAVWLPGPAVVLVLVAGGAGLGVLRLLRRRRRARQADARADEVLAACESIAAELVAGQPPFATLSRAAEQWPELAPVAAAGVMGADVPAAMRELAALPGAAQLRTVAASWQVAHDSGAGLAAAIARAGTSIRADRGTARLVAAELAAARATARLLALLPVGVLLLGTGVGGDPLGLLLTTPFGLACLAVGTTLSLGGLTWLEHIADRVLRR